MSGEASRPYARRDEQRRVEIPSSPHRGDGGRGRSRLDGVTGSRHGRFGMASCGHHHLRQRTPLRGTPSNRDSRGRDLRCVRHTRLDRAAASTHPSAARPTAATTSRDSLATSRAASRRRLREQLRAHLRRHRYGYDAERACPIAAHPRAARACARPTPYDRSEPRSTPACARLHRRHLYKTSTR
jgi:hypothetical protein